MPELPDIVVYVEQLENRLAGRRLESVRVSSPFLERTWDPPLESICGKLVVGLRRIGKRIVLELEDNLFLVLHLMIAGRLHWKPRGAKIPGKTGLASLTFEGGTLLLTEAGTKKRAALWLVRGRDALAQFDRGGLEVLDAGLDGFRQALLRENHTLKRALTDPRLFSGIGNAYSDEILHHARLSPLKRTAQLDESEIGRLHRAAQQVLHTWIERLRRSTGDRFPEKVTAFRDGMAVHGRYRQPCPECGTPVQRIVHAENEINYCPKCQTGGRLLADRALSRLLRQDWPRNLDEFEEIKKTVKERGAAPVPSPLVRSATRRFSGRAQYYVAHRPGYPEEVLHCLCQETGLSTDWIVADIGSGTGKLSEIFLRFGNLVYGIEPNDEMRAAAESSLSSWPGFVSIKGTAEATSMPDGSVDLIVAGQSFHWFDREKARMEFSRILKSEGWVALVWNRRKTDASGLMQEYERLRQSLPMDEGQVDHRDVTDEVIGGFMPGARKRTFRNTQDFNFEKLAGRLLSSSYAPLPGSPEFERMMTELQHIFDLYQKDGVVHFEYDTELYFGRSSV